MLEIYSLPIGIKFLKEFLVNCRKSDFYREKRKGTHYVTLIKDQLGTLKHYDFIGYPAVFLAHQGVYDLKYLSDYWKLAEALKGEFTLTSHFGVLESGGAIKAPEISDLVLRFSASGAHCMIALSVREVSPGSANLDYRRKLFTQFLEALGVSDHLKVVYVEEELDLQIEGEEFVFRESFSKGSLWEDYQKGLKPVGKRVCNFHGRNFKDLEIYFLTLEELKKGVEEVLDLYGRDNIPHARLSGSFPATFYEENFEALNRSPFAPWRVSFSALTKYSLSELDQAVRENPSFFIPAFALETLSIGLIEVDLFYKNKKFILKFCCEQTTSLKEPALHGFITELAGGRKIIDPDSLSSGM